MQKEKENVSYLSHMYRGNIKITVSDNRVRKIHKDNSGTPKEK